MPSKQELRSEETKRSILAAAGMLFAERGFNTVTMREIAKEAGCSHTTIYIYFKDKEALLHQLAMSPLEQLKQLLEGIADHTDYTPEHKLKAITREMIHFCLQNRNMHELFFMVRSTQVTVTEPGTELNKIRNALFALLMKVVQECVPLPTGSEQLLSFSRIYFYTLQGMIGTYIHSEESVEELMDRLGSTFDEAVEVLLIGFATKMNKRS